jgi:hypothetical protein
MINNLTTGSSWVTMYYQNNFIYLKANKLIDEKYDRGKRLKKKIFIIGGAIVLAAIGLLIFKRLK